MKKFQRGCLSDNDIKISAELFVGDCDLRVSVEGFSDDDSPGFWLSPETAHALADWIKANVERPKYET